VTAGKQRQAVARAVKTVLKDNPEVGWRVCILGQGKHPAAVMATRNFPVKIRKPASLDSCHKADGIVAKGNHQTGSPPRERQKAIGYQLTLSLYTLPPARSALTWPRRGKSLLVVSGMKILTLWRVT
jgi:riboflavin biosynthesis pyrimidine reductase